MLLHAVLNKQSFQRLQGHKRLGAPLTRSVCRRPSFFSMRDMNSASDTWLKGGRRDEEQEGHAAG